MLLLPAAVEAGHTQQRVPNALTFTARWFCQLWTQVALGV